MNGWGGIGPRWRQPTDRCDLSAKINLHEVGHEIDLKADRPTPGSADLCLLVQDSLDDVVLGSVGVMSTVLVRSAGLARMGLSPRRMSGTLTGI
uniref:Uncharacterized protein n=1 Tax=Bifidobacterium asteroides TaxID=1684 RepID=A0ABS3ISX4_9BIFI